MALSVNKIASERSLANQRVASKYHYRIPSKSYDGQMKAFCPLILAEKTKQNLEEYNNSSCITSTITPLTNLLQINNYNHFPDE